MLSSFSLFTQNKSVKIATNLIKFQVVGRLTKIYEEAS